MTHNIPKLLVFVALLLSLSLPSCMIHKIGGAFRHEPEELSDNISSGAKNLIRSAFEEIPPERLRDYHTHIAGLGTGNSGDFVNPKMRTWLHPVRHLKLNVYLSAAGVRDHKNADQEYSYPK